MVNTNLISEIVSTVEEGIIGRVANKVGDRRTNNLEILLETVFQSGGGNYLEIGSLFGGSAISVALLKNALHQDGFVFCVDPLNGYYYNLAPRADMIDTQSGVPVTETTFFNNVNKFNVSNRICLIKCYSDYVYFNRSLKFSVVYIDGDHRNGMPLYDFNLVRNVVTDYIVFDNHSDTHPEVQYAVEYATNHTEWVKVHEEDITCVLKKVNLYE